MAYAYSAFWKENMKLLTVTPLVKGTEGWGVERVTGSWHFIPSDAVQMF